MVEFLVATVVAFAIRDCQMAINVPVSSAVELFVADVTTNQVCGNPQDLREIVEIGKSAFIEFSEVHFFGY